MGQLIVSATGLTSFFWQMLVKFLWQSECNFLQSVGSDYQGWQVFIIVKITLITLIKQ
jgi:hypothetical protein